MNPGTSEMHFVQALDSVGIARELIKHGASVDATTTEGVTPLMIAAAHDNAPMIGLLLQSGAKPGLKNADDETARDIAAKNDNGSATRMLDLMARMSPPPAKSEAH